MVVEPRAGITELVPYSPGKPIEELQRELGLARVYKLASNENPLGPSPRAMEAVRASLDGAHYYPDSNAFYLKQRLSEHIGVRPEELLIANGTNDAIEIVVRAFALADSSAVISAGSFVAYKIVCKVTGVEIDEVPLRPDYGFDLEAMLARVRPNTRYFFIANPNNPTGLYVNQEQLVSLLERVPRHVLVMLDEAYFEYVERPDYPNGLTLRERFPNLVVFRTFSKCYGLAGLRIGYAVMPAAMVDVTNRTRQPFNTNTLAQNAARAALDDSAFLERSLRHNREVLPVLMEGARALGLEALESVANFVLIKLGCDGRKVFEALLPYGVIVRPMDPFGLPNHIRVSVGRQAEVEVFLQALKEILPRIR